MRRAAAKGIATVVGAVIIAFIIVLFTGLFLAFIDALGTVNEVVSVRYSAAQQISGLARSVSGWYAQRDGNLLIHIENPTSVSLSLGSVFVVYGDGSYIAIDRNNQTGIRAEVTVRSAAGDVGTFQQLSFPLQMGPGDTVDILLYGMASKEVVSVSLGLTAAPHVVEPISLPPARLLPTTAPAALHLLKHVVNDGGSTWLGPVRVPTIETYPGSVVEVVNVSGNILQGGRGDVAAADGSYLSVELPYFLALVENNVILYEDFDENPLGTKLIVASGDWSWKIDCGYSGACIYQGDTSGGEYIAYFEPSPIYSEDEVYVLVHVEHRNPRRNLWADLILYQDSSHFYTLGSNAERDVVGIWKYDGSFEPLASEGGHISIRRWYAYLARYVRSSGLMSISVYDIDVPGKVRYVGTASARDVELSPVYVGLGTRDENAYFDNIVVSRANPRYVNVTGLGPGWTVKLYDAGGRLVAEATDDDGDGVASLDVIAAPILKSGRLEVYDADGTLLLNYTFANGEPYPIIGGNVYRVAVLLLDVYTSLDRPDLITILELNLTVSFWADSELNYTLYVYDHVLEKMVEVQGGVYTPDMGSVTLNVELAGDASRYLDQNLGAVVRLQATPIGSGSAVVYVDALNLRARAAVEPYTTRTVLVVGRGGDTAVDFYAVSSASDGLSLEYMLSVDTITVFDGSADIAVIPGSDVLVLANSSGIYTYNITSGKWSLLTDQCRVLGVGARLEVLEAPSGYQLFVLAGGESNLFCIVDADTGAASVGQLPDSSLAPRYSCSAVSGAEVYVQLEAPSGPLLYAYNASDGSWRRIASAPGSRCVGMAYGDGRVLAMYERGPLYSIEAASGQVNLVNATVAYFFQPYGFGDRLEYYDGMLVFVRADGTREAWIISVER
ncbi:MAG: hypothetical protein ABWW70_02700 [Thermoproteota archaeon]